MLSPIVGKAARRHVRLEFWRAAIAAHRQRPAQGAKPPLLVVANSIEKCIRPHRSLRLVKKRLQLCRQGAMIPSRTAQRVVKCAELLFVIGGFAIIFVKIPRLIKADRSDQQLVSRF